MDATSNFKEILNCDEVCNYLAKFIKTCSKKDIKITLHHNIYILNFSMVLLVFIFFDAYVSHLLYFLCILAFEAGSVICKSRSQKKLKL